MRYPAELVAPFAKDLTDFGFESLKSESEVVEAIEQTKGTLLVVVNSVCGCAAANARPAAKMAIKNEKKPNRITTVFAGVDTEATAKAREFMVPYPPSSPSMALFKDGELVHFIERMEIEGRTAESIAYNLISAFEKHC